jgi:hypothetical protein
MDNLSRCKGRRGEQELARLLSDELGSVVARNLMQFREGGHDLLGLDGWSIEVKRAAQPQLTEWWIQALAQA